MQRYLKTKKLYQHFNLKIAGMGLAFKGLIGSNQSKTHRSSCPVCELQLFKDLESGGSIAKFVVSDVV